MRTHHGRFLTAAALLPLLCGTANSRLLPQLPEGRRDTGGVYLILGVRAAPAALEQSVRQTARVIETRCGYLGVYCKVERQGGKGSNRIKLRVSGAQDFARVKAVLLAEGRLELRPVVSPSSPRPLKSYRTRREAAAAARTRNYEVMPYEELGVDKGFLTVEREPVVAGSDVRDASAFSIRGEGDDYSVTFTLKPEAAQRFGAWTGANVYRYIAIILNGRVRSAPYIRGVITDNGQIIGNFTREQAEDIALTLRSGNLPARLEVLKEGTYKAASPAATPDT